MQSPLLNTRKAENPWTGGFRPNPAAKMTLFCLPYAGGTNRTFRRWPELISGQIDVCPLSLPGRAGRIHEEPFSHLNPLVECLAEVLLPYTDRPYALFGHSMGALISFQLARLLRESNCPLPAHLFVSACRAPQIPDPDPPTFDLPEPEFIAELRRLNGTPSDVLMDAELIQLMLPLLRADFAVCQTYRYAQAPPLTCPITVFGGLQDFDVPRAHLAAWREQTTEPFALRMLPGDHFFLTAHEPILVETIARVLSRPTSPSLA